MKSFLLIILISIITVPVKSLVIIDSILATQCIYYMKQYDWGCNSTSQNAKAYKCRCFNIDWIGSVTSCFESEGESRSVIDHAYRHLRQRCLDKGHIEWPVDVLKAYQENATSYLVEASDINEEVQTYTPLSVNATAFEYPRRSFNHVYAQVVRSQAYQWGYIFFWTSVLLIGTVFNFSRHFIFKYINSNKSKFTSNFINKLRYRLTVPNLLSKSYYRIFGFWPIQIPTRIEAFVVMFYLIYMVLASCTGYTIELPNMYMNGHIWQLLDFIGYRTGLGSFALIPPTFFFGIRNNPFIKLTGSSLSTFLFYHKWCAIGMSVQALIHSAVWTDYTIREGDYSAWAMDDYWIWGIVGTTVLFLMIFQANLIFREAAYEIFLLIHQLFGILFIISMWFHCSIMGWMAWLYVCIVVWCYDRIVRFISVLWNGGAKAAKITKLDDNLIRVLIANPTRVSYFPGCTYYIYFLHFKMRFWQSHPFSVMKSKRKGEEGYYCIVFKTHKGITGKVQKMMNKEEKPSRLTSILSEGPYGSPNPLRSHEQYVFLSTGIGFTPCYSQAVDIIEHNQKGSGPKQLIKFVWVVRSLHYYSLFKEDMDYLITNGVELEVIITGTDETKESVENFSCCDKLLTASNTNIKVLNKRPDAGELIKATNLSYSTTFISSGTSSFTNSARDAVRELIKDSTVRIDFFEESFVM